jgi:SAM-dependent methyltransferase
MKYVKYLGRKLNLILGHYGLKVVRVTKDKVIEGLRDDIFLNSEGKKVKINLTPMTPNNQTSQGVMWSLANIDKAAPNQSINEAVWYASFGLYTFLKNFKPGKILDIGSHRGAVSRLFRFLGYEVTTLEICKGFPEPDYREDYLKIKFPEKFNYIWCSHVLEHQRNISVFLEKCLDDLQVGGMLLITVPLEHCSINLTWGHANNFSVQTLLYNLASAGFDVKSAPVAVYNQQISVFAVKPDILIDNVRSFAPYPKFNKSNSEIEAVALEHEISVESFREMIEEVQSNIEDFYLDEDITWKFWPTNPNYTAVRS